MKSRDAEGHPGFLRERTGDMPIYVASPNFLRYNLKLSN